MSEVMRWETTNCDATWCGKPGHMEEDDNGRFVAYSDYAALSARVAELEADLARLREPWAGLSEKARKIFQELQHGLALSPDGGILGEELARCMASRAQLEALLREWQEWEARWIMADEAWVDGLPKLTQALYDEYVMKLQAKRESALAGKEVQNG